MNVMVQVTVIIVFIIFKNHLIIDIILGELEGQGQESLKVGKCVY